MAKYKLSISADRDVEKLFEYGINNFGLVKARSYVDGLINQFHSIAENPYHYQAVDHIRRGYRRSIYGKHAIYYVVFASSVHIMRILRSENLDTAL